MREDLLVGAAGFFEGVGENCKAVGVQGAGGQGAIVVGGRRQCRHGGGLPGGVEGDGAEGVAEDAANYVALRVGMHHLACPSQAASKK